MAIFMTVREEYEDALWRGKDVVACLPESVVLFSFSSRHDGPVIDVLADDTYPATGNCCTYTSRVFFCMFDCSIYASGRGVPSVFCGFEDLAAQICGGGNGKQKGLLTRRRPCRAAVVGCYYVIFLLLLTREATMSFLGTPCQYISVKIFVCHSFVHLVSISVNTTVTGLLHNGPVRLFPLLRSP